MDKTSIEIYQGTSKKGKQFEALKISIGRYSALLFPTPVEMFYIKSLLKKENNNVNNGEDDGE